MAIKISVGGRSSVFTKIRLYRSLDIDTVYQEDNFLKEVPAADVVVDDSTTRQPDASVFYYGIRFLTEDGASHDTSPHIVRNVYDTGITWHSDLDNPFISGNGKYGIIRMDDATDVKIPSNEEVISFIRNLYPDIAFEDNLPTGKRICGALNGNIYFFGTPWLKINQSYKDHLATINQMRSLAIEPPNERTTLIKDGEKWCLTFIDNEEYSHFAYLVNSADTLGDNFPITRQGTTIVGNTSMPNIETDESYYVVTGASNVPLTMSARQASTTTVTHYFGLVMKYLGKV